MTTTHDRQRRTRGGERTGQPGPAGTVLTGSPGEIRIQRRRRAGGPAYIRVRKGDAVVEGDRGAPVGALERWVVTAVTPDLVAAVDRDGHSVAWPRDRVERALAVGELSTPLRGFERVVAHGPADGSRPVDVTGYGDDGRRYLRTYAPDGRGGLGLVRESYATRTLPPEMRAELDDRVAAVLADAGDGIGRE
jgi:hypothetical protein